MQNMVEERTQAGADTVRVILRTRPANTANSSLQTASYSKVRCKQSRPGTLAGHTS